MRNRSRIMVGWWLIAGLCGVVLAWSSGLSVPASAGTVGCEIACVPDAGALPFLTSMSVSLSNTYTGFTRQIAGRLDVTTAGGNYYSNWRSGYTKVQPGGTWVTNFSVTLPASSAFVGLNRFQLLAEDVTPPPYNHTPYPPSGDAATDLCVIRGYLNPPEMVLIPAGEYEMGDHHDGIEYCLPIHTVYIDAFSMDTFEVTNQQYAAALNWAWAQGGLITVASGVVYKYGSGSSYPYCDTTTSSPYSRISWSGSAFGVVAGKADHPMVMVSWYGAAAYSNWRSAMEGRAPSYETDTWKCDFQGDGYRLPTEAEWEKAARGGLYSPYRRYPWGDSLISNIANYWDSFDPYEVSGFEPYTTPGGFYNGELHYKTDFGWPGSQTSYQTADGENGWGLYDMAGGVWEWCNDWYSPDYYSSSPYSNPRGPASSPYGWRVLRGGTWHYNAYYLRCAYRSYGYPDGRLSYDGFRLALGAE